MDNYDVIEVEHTSDSKKSIVLKVREKGKNNDKLYALKLVGSLDNSFQRLLFKREVEALRKLNACKNVVKIRDNRLNYSFMGKNTWGAILLDYVYGKNLEKYDFSSIPIEKRYEICLKVLCAVEDAHSYSVLHRDIKPSNIMYDEETEEVTLIDFGTSKIKSIVENETTMPFYSPNYSAPEVVSGNGATEASDIYSLGAVIFYILYGITPNGTEMIIDTLEDVEAKEDVRTVISKMVANNPEERYQSVGDVVDVFSRIIGDGVQNVNNYICAIDVEKLENLKRRSIVDRNMTMAIFTNSFLNTQFRNCTAYMNNNNLNYYFTGKNICVECSYDSQDNVFKVAKIYPITLDKRMSNEKRGLPIKGCLRFYDISRRDGWKRLGYNNNDSLLNDFEYYSSEKNDIQKQSEMFDDLFGKWRDGIEETIHNEKDRAGSIIYSDVELLETQLILTVQEYKNRDIDDIPTETQYIIEDNTTSGLSVYYDIGSFNNIEYTDDNTVIIIDLSKKFQRARVKRLLTAHKKVTENFRANIAAYNRQKSAIKALFDDNYSARNLKDILLNLKEPDATPTLDDIELSSDDFNKGQKEAIKKVLYSDSISLIQGPPGTGKTKVIKEIVKQVVSSVDKVEDMPKILIVSQSHTAVDNIIEDLIDFNGLQIIRIGKKENVAKKVYDNCSLESIHEEMFDEIISKSNSYIENTDEKYRNITNKLELERWAKIKDIQKDWVERCNSVEALDYQLIRCATIIAGTCVGFLSNDYVKDLEFDYVIIDEAAKATTPELLVSIIKAKKIVLVGDQNQLPAYADVELSPMLAGLTKNPQFRLFDILFEILPETHKQILTEQYRMKKNIGDLVSKVFYNSMVSSPVPDSEREHGISMFKGKSIIWIDTSKMKNKNESNRKGGSFCNHSENTIIKNMILKFRKEKILKNLNIGIITGYKGQKELIRKTVANNGFDKEAKLIDVNTLDAFQGRENDIIIYSTVRTKRSIGFQKEKERVNVAFSRARKLLIICGDLEFFYHFDDPDNKYIEIIDYLYEHGDECAIIDGEKF